MKNQALLIMAATVTAQEPAYYMPNIQPGMTKAEYKAEVASASPAIEGTSDGFIYRGHVTYRVRVQWYGDKLLKVWHENLD